MCTSLDSLSLKKNSHNHQQYDTYTSTKSGLSPEIIHFHQIGDYRGQKEDWYIKPSRDEDTIDGRYILRPETVESIFVAFRLSGNNKYREWGWSIFESIEKHAKINSGGYASIMNVNKVPVDHEDKMETFLLVGVVIVCCFRCHAYHNTE